MGGGGERVTLRITAEHANAWNTFGPPEVGRAKNEHLDRWCEEVGGAATSIERTVILIERPELDHVDQYLAYGATRLIFGLAAAVFFRRLREPLQRARG